MPCGIVSFVDYHTKASPERGRPLAPRRDGGTPSKSALTVALETTVGGQRHASHGPRLPLQRRDHPSATNG